MYKVKLQTYELNYGKYTIRAIPQLNSVEILKKQRVFLHKLDLTVATFPIDTLIKLLTKAKEELDND